MVEKREVRLLLAATRCGMIRMIRIKMYNEEFAGSLGHIVISSP